MFKQFMIGGIALATVAGVAFAENAAGNPPAGAQAGAQMADTAGNPPPQPPGADPQQDEGQGWWGRHMHRHGWRHGGEMGPGPMAMNGPMGGPGQPMGGPGRGMMMDQQGFRLMLGNGVNVGVMCGKEALKDCIAEAQPLIDAAKAAAMAPAPATKTP